MRGKRSTSSPVSDSVRRVRWSVSSSRGGRSSRSWRTTSTASPGSEGVPSSCSAGGGDGGFGSGVWFLWARMKAL